MKDRHFSIRRQRVKMFQRVCRVLVDLLVKVHEADSLSSLIDENLERTVIQLKIIQEISNAPSVFCNSLVEMNRRYTYSTYFRKVLIIC